MADRNYPQGGSGGGGFLPQLTPVVKALLILNVLIYFVDISVNKQIRLWGAFTVNSSILEGRIWEFVTFQFLHGHLFHLLANSIGLYFFGPWMERWWGSKRFVAFYLLSGAGGAAFFTLLTFIGLLPNDYRMGLVGASAGIYGILAGIAMIAPHARVRLLFPPIELTMRQLALAVLGIAVAVVVFRIGDNAGGEAGHLGGALVGFLLVKFPKLISWGGRRGVDVDIIRPKAFKRRSEAKLRPRSSVNLQQETEVDRILDKVNERGIQSLTDEERALLQRASKPNTMKR